MGRVDVDSLCESLYEYGLLDEVEIMRVNKKEAILEKELSSLHSWRAWVSDPENNGLYDLYQQEALEIIKRVCL